MIAANSGQTLATASCNTQQCILKYQQGAENQCWEYWRSNLYTDHLPSQQPVRDHVQGAREEREEPAQPSPE